MLPQFTVDQLQSLTRPQLWELCRERGLKCYPASANCIQTILDNQKSIEKVEVKTCANCPLFRPFADGTGRGLCCGSDQVARDHHPQTQDCLHQIEEQCDFGEKQETEAAPNTNDFQVVKSGSLVFKPSPTLLKTFMSYEVWAEDTKYGFIGMLESGRWIHGYGGQTCGTPYEAAAALIEAVQLRQARSQEIQVLEHWEDKFVVRNNQNGHHYVVQPNHLEPCQRCECGDWHFRGAKCKHQIAVADRIKIESFLEDIEVDSTSDPDFGALHRVWREKQLLGTFYKAIDGYWVAQPCASEKRPRSLTATQAQISILAASKMLVVGDSEQKEMAIA